MAIPNAIFTSNRVLAAIPQAEEAILRPNLSRVQLVKGQVLIEQGQVSEHVYFIEHGVAVLRARTAPTHPPVQITMIGREGLVGALALLDVDTPAFGEVVMLLPGTALRISVAALQRVFKTTPMLQASSLIWMSALARQLMQACASGLTDTLIMRCTRWLLMVHHRSDGDDLAVTHEVIADALGVGRARVTVAVVSLQQAGLICTRRGCVRSADSAEMGRLVEHGSIENAAERLAPQSSASPAAWYVPGVT